MEMTQTGLIVVVGMMLAILSSLGIGLYYLLVDYANEQHRAVKALTVRISLSILLFSGSLIAAYFGIVNFHPFGY